MDVDQRKCQRGRQREVINVTKQYAWYVDTTFLQKIQQSNKKSWMNLVTSARHFRRSQPPMPAAFYNAALADLPSLLIILMLMQESSNLSSKVFRA